LEKTSTNARLIMRSGRHFIKSDALAGQPNEQRVLNTGR
jgi:hypothetical protein